MAVRTKNVDWKAVRRRLDIATKATEAAINPPPDRLRRMLEQRTRTVAAAMERAPTPDLAYLVPFTLSGTSFAIAASYVREVLPLPAVTPVPRSPLHVVGVMDLRGQILPVFALGSLLGLPADAPGQSARVLICGTTQAEFAAIADDVAGPLEVPTRETTALSELRADADHAGPPWTRGKDRNGRTVIDGAALLEDARLFIE
jgi:chemotaxis signal transduction protein